MHILEIKLQIISVCFLSDPFVPVSLQLINRSSSSFFISWMQYGHFSNFFVTVDYKNYHNVTDNITFVPTHSSDSNGTLVHCNISSLLIPGGNYTVHVSAVFEQLEGGFLEHSFLTSKLFKHFRLLRGFCFYLI